MGMLENNGIYGWQDIEPTILATLLSGNAPLLIGDHGSNKTVGAEIISRMILGEDINFKSYEVPVLNMDDLVGYPNPASLSKGTFEWVETPLSIWNADVVLFDELNRANPFVQGKLHETVRTKKLLGQPTKLKLVWSAVNPPDGKYDSAPMGLALASRFVSINVPGTKETKSYLDKILSNDFEADDTDYQAMWRRAQGFLLPDEQINAIKSALSHVVDIAIESGINYSIRQAKMAYQLICAGLKLDAAGFFQTDSQIFANFCISTMPECFGILATATIQPHLFKSQLMDVLENIKIRDALVTCNSMTDIINLYKKGTYADNQALISALANEIQGCRLVELENAITSMGRELRQSMKEVCKSRWVNLKMANSTAQSYKWLKGEIVNLTSTFDQAWEKLN